MASPWGKRKKQKPMQRQEILHVRPYVVGKQKLFPPESKEPRETRGSFFVLVHHCDVGRLGSLGTLLDSEFDLLSLLQVTETVALNGGEMDENVLSTFALDKTETLVPVEPLDCTNCSFRHCICLLWQFKFFLGILFVASEGKTKQPTDSNRELWLFF